MPSGSEIEVIYRVVGATTRWMASLGRGDPVSLLGPLGNGFPIDARKTQAWMVSGGVGLPPMLYLAKALKEAGKLSVAICGARSLDLLPLTLLPDVPLPTTATEATPASEEFNRSDTTVVVSTDDGSGGFAGHAGAALVAYHRKERPPSDELVVYTCGPEPLLRFVAEYCAAEGIECYVCMERAMACGTGLCQACVVGVHDPAESDKWRYELCCKDGPVFLASRIIWDPAPLKCASGIGASGTHPTD